MKPNLAQRIVDSNVTLLTLFLLILASVTWMMSRMDAVNDEIVENNLSQLTALSALNHGGLARLGPTSSAHDQ